MENTKFKYQDPYSMYYHQQQKRKRITSLNSIVIHPVLRRKLIDKNAIMTLSTKLNTLVFLNLVKPSSYFTYHQV